LDSLLRIKIFATDLFVFHKSVAVQALRAELAHSGISLGALALRAREWPFFMPLQFDVLIHRTLLVDLELVFVCVRPSTDGKTVERWLHYGRRLRFWKLQFFRLVMLWHSTIVEVLQVDGDDLIVRHLLDPLLPFGAVVQVVDVLAFLGVSHVFPR